MSNIDILVMEARKSKIYLVIEEGQKKLESYFYNGDYVTDILINTQLVEKYIGEKSLRREINKFSAETLQKIVNRLQKEQERFDAPKRRLFAIAEEIAKGEKLALLKNIITICCTPEKYAERINFFYLSPSEFIKLGDSTLFGIIGNLHLQKVVLVGERKFEYPVMSEKALLLEVMNKVESNCNRKN